MLPIGTYNGINNTFTFNCVATLEVDRFGIRLSAAEFGPWIKSFLRLKEISDDSAQQLTYLFQDQLAYSLPPFGDQLIQQRKLPLHSRIFQCRTE